VLTSEFDYDLPPELIAQRPIEPRDASRLLVVDRAAGALTHRRFTDLPEYLRPGDVLVANESRVIPARLRARKEPTGGQVEILLLARQDDLRWEALAKGRRFLPGQRFRVRGPGGEAGPAGTVEEVTEAGGRILRFDEPLEPYLGRVGETPLPPYIHEPLADPERYQTVYARVQGSAAAPTAGLHFTPSLVRRIEEAGVGWTSVVLHIGLDTFRPVTEETVEAHRIHSEYGVLSAAAAERVNVARSRGGRVIAVGTTAVRVLETAAGEDGRVAPWEGHTRLFIYPGYRFRAVDALVTNFHLPRSSLLMLVSAFAGTDFVRRAYREAVAARYRFYSFGDSMLIL
jgi:S-adenosylmethionine:tRNA ribosyltransferase-isomerase